MKRKSLSQMALVFIPILSLLFITPNAFGQSDTGAGNAIQKSPQVTEYDKSALEKLQSMTPEEVEGLDRMLAEAMTLFYDREYAKALPIFKEISARVETMDVAFWYASCAANAGETDLAIRKFSQMLEVDPNLHRVRLELATVYYGLGRYDDARHELNRVLEAEPPEGVKNNIERLLAAIKEKTKKLYTNVRFSTGIQRDSNVSVGPDQQFIAVPSGGILGPLTTTQTDLYDWVVVLDFYGNALYDIGEKQGFMWNTTGSFYQTHNQRWTQFDYTQWRVTSGPWWVDRRSILKVPVGWAQNYFSHDTLFDTWDISPSYEYFLHPNFSLRGMIVYSEDSYKDIINEPQDNINRMFEFNFNLYFNNRSDLLSFFLSGENLNANAPRWSYNAFNAAVSYFNHFRWFSTWDMELYTRFKYSKRDYDAAIPLWPTAYFRVDEIYNFYVSLNRNFSRYCFASIYYNYLRDDSNTDLYDYDKFILGLNIGVKF